MTANPNASEDAKKVLSYIASLPNRPDKRVVSGQNIGWHPRDIVADYERTVAGLHAQTGKWVGLVGTTYGFAATPDEIHAANEQVLIPYWEAGGLITIDMSPMNPWTGGYPTDLTGRNLIELIDPESEVYPNWIAQLDVMAAGLAELRDAGVVVLWRPLREMTYTELFWYDAGCHGGEWIDGVYYPVSEPYVNVWRHMFDYFTYEKGLNNLLWVYSPHGETDNWCHVDSMWPGDGYVDISGLDVYDNYLKFGPGDQPYERLIEKGKPITFLEQGQFDITVGGEHGTGSQYDTRNIIESIKENYPRIVMWQSWHSWDPDPVTGDYLSKCALVDNLYATELLNDPWVITRDGVDWRTEESTMTLKKYLEKLKAALVALQAADLSAIIASLGDVSAKLAALSTDLSVLNLADVSTMIADIDATLVQLEEFERLKEEILGVE